MPIKRTRRSGTVAAALLLGAAATSGCGLLGAAAEGDGGGGGAGDHPFTVAFGGDVHFEGMISTRLQSAPDTVFGPIAAEFRKADLAMVNLETAITEGGTPAPKDYTFRAPPAAFQALRTAGLDVVTMANNHGMDYGEAGLQDSLAASGRAGFPVVGIGRNAAEAYRPWTTTVKGTKIAVIGATQVLDDNLIESWTATDAKAGVASAKNAPRLVQAVQRARKEAHVVIVNLHWGQERNSCATPAQRQLAGQLADAGADAIVGSHAHVLQAGGYLKGKYVHYGLGNFVFYNGSGPTAQSGVLTLTFDPKVKDTRVTKASWAPAVVTDGVPQPLAGASAQQARTQWEGLRNCADVKAGPAA
ncbi:CapA family protein [Spirillospora sp. NPDC047279]|uniref:CapA family protein n=1 Tax=Spirillospora sp. NPDC047279 TaxID=3155478 RepID=UPI0033C050F1